MSVKKSPLPYKLYYLLTVLINLLGVATAGYLTQTHYKNYTDPAFSSFCAISKAINCDTVAQSPWSVLFGLPVSVWGLLGYLVFFIILLNARNDQKRLFLWNLLLLLGGVYSVIALYFSYISAVKINSYCILCMITYGVNFALFFLTLLVIRRFNTNFSAQGFTNSFGLLYKKITTLSLPLGMLTALFTCIHIYIPHYWEYSFPAPDISEAGITDAGSPWIGAADAPTLIIEEYSDYQCFQCKKMHFLIRQLIAEHPDKIRLIHHHFPMDHTVNEIVVPTPFHIGSGKMALLAVYAAYKGKFWEMNDALYAMASKKAPFNTKLLAEKTTIPSGELAGAVKNDTIQKILRNDIRKGMKLGITATPSFVINGEVYVGAIPPDILKDFVK